VLAACAAVARLFAPLAAAGVRGNLEPQGDDWLSEGSLFVFQLAASVVVHLVATRHHETLFGRLPHGVRLLLQPALLSAVALMLIAGGTNAGGGGFMEGLDRYVLRTPSSKTIFEPGCLANWGPGKLIVIHLNPAITVLAFPTSLRMADVRPTLHVLVPVVAAAALFSLYSMALLARVMLGGAPTVALSILPHSVSTAVAVGYVGLLCKDGDDSAAPQVCASTSVVATTCIVTGTLVMVCGRRVLDLLHVTSPFARGMAAGSSGMALGVAALRAGGEEAATGVAAFAYALFAVLTSVFLFLDFLVEHLTTLTG